MNIEFPNVHSNKENLWDEAFFVNFSSKSQFLVGAFLILGNSMFIRFSKIDEHRFYEHWNISKSYGHCVYKHLSIGLFLFVWPKKYSFLEKYSLAKCIRSESIRFYFTR